MGIPSDDVTGTRDGVTGVDDKAIAYIYDRLAPPTLLIDTPLAVMLWGPDPHQYEAVERRYLTILKRRGLIRYCGYLDTTGYMYWGRA